MKLVVGLLLAVIYSYFILPKKEQEEPKIKITLFPIMYNGMVMIPISKEKCFHIHHWIIYFLIFILSFFVNIPEIIVGFSIGLFLQGLSYDDCFEFVANNPY
tara:strand:- start:6099 stop:6404 length:306 start_codon:yes stop_codon:yes gene_type:complete